MLPKNYVVIDEEEMTYVEGGKTYKYQKGDKAGMEDCYVSAATLAYVAGVSWIVTKASAACSLVSGGIGAVIGGFFKLVQWASAYFAQQFFVAGETAKAIYKKSAYSITVNMVCGVPTSVVCC